MKRANVGISASFLSTKGVSTSMVVRSISPRQYLFNIYIVRSTTPGSQVHVDLPIRNHDPGYALILTLL